MFKENVEAKEKNINTNIYLYVYFLIKNMMLTICEIITFQLINRMKRGKDIIIGIENIWYYSILIYNKTFQIRSYSQYAEFWKKKVANKHYP